MTPGKDNGRAVLGDLHDYDLDHALDGFGGDLRTLALTVSPHPQFVATLRQEVQRKLLVPVQAVHRPARFWQFRLAAWVRVFLVMLVLAGVLALLVPLLSAYTSKPIAEPQQQPETVRPLDPLPPGALARLGKGQALHFALDASGSLAVGSSAGVCLYGPDLSQQWCVWSQSAVTHLSFNQDGSLLAAGQADGQVLVLDPFGAQVGELIAFGRDAITGLDWMPGRPLLLVASTRSAQVKAWDWEKGGFAWDAGRVAGQSTAMASARRPALLALATDAGIVLLEAQQGRPLHRQDTGSARPVAAAFSEDGRFLVAGLERSGSDPSVVAWRVTDWAEIGSWSIDSGAVSLALSPVGGLAVVSDAGDVWVGSLDRSALEHADEAQPGSPLAWALDGESFYTVRQNGSVGQIMLEAGRPLAVMLDYTGPVDAVSWTEQGSVLSLYSNAYIGGWNASDKTLDTARPIYIKDPVKPFLLTALPSSTGEGRFLDWSPDGRRILLALGEEAVLINASSGREVTRLGPHSARVVKAAFSPDSRQVVTADQSARLRIWNSVDGSLVRTLEPLTIGATVTGLGWLPGISPGVTASSLAVTWLNSARYALDLVDPVSGQDHRLPDIKESLGKLAWSLDGRWVTSVVGRGVMVWDVKSRELSYTLPLDPVDWRSVSLSISPDGRYLAIGGENITLWDLSSGEKVETYAGHNAAVSGLGFSPDSTRLVSGSSDGVLLVWDPSP